MQRLPQEIAGDDLVRLAAPHEVLGGEFVGDEAALRMNDDTVTVGEAELHARPRHA